MQSVGKNMTRGNPLKLILALSLPLMVANAFQQLYTVADTAIVGSVLGLGALAALGAVDLSLIHICRCTITLSLAACPRPAWCPCTIS